MKVKNWIKREPVTIHRTAMLQDALELMKKHSIRHLPVVDDGQLVGFITESDIRQFFFPSMVEDIPVHQVMVINPITINANASIEMAARLIHDYKIGGLPVLDKKKLVGVITASDLLSAFIDVMGLLKASARLDVLVDRMMREFRVQANVGRPRVAYRESISRPVEKLDYKYSKQTGGHGQYGHIVLNFEPGERGSGILFENKIFGGAIPKEYIPAVEKGVREAAESGVLAGYPVVDLKVTLVDGSFHEVDSSDMAFKITASMAFKEGVQKGGPVLLEPMMKVEVVVPEEYLGDIIGQLNSRRGNILGMEMRAGNAQAIRALVPLAEMFGYATELRSATQGRGVFSMEFDHYQPLPENVAQEMLK